MSYCLNPHCQKPQNHKDANFCLTCGTKLLLKERYRAIKPIGQGGFGRTLLAIDEDKPSKPLCIIRYLQIVKASSVGIAVPSTPVYLGIRNICKRVRYFISWIWISLKKILSQAQGTNKSQKNAKLFEQEAEKLDRLGKNNQIPELLAYLTQEGSQYLVQEYIHGCNLAEILLKQGKFNERQIWKLLKSLLPVLEYIHSHEVIHRDIKPENIILSRDEKLYLVDFGAAKVVTGKTMFKTGTSIGTPEFVAPEQIRGKALYSSDLYSLGVTCIYLLTGISPFDLFDISENTWVWRQSLVDNPLSEQLAIILDKLIENATSLRYQSASEVLKDIDFHHKNTAENKEKINSTTPQKTSNYTTVKSQSASEVLKDIDSHKKTSKNQESINYTTPQKTSNSTTVKSQSEIKKSKDIDSQNKTYKNQESINNKTQQKSSNSPKVKPLNYSYWRYIYNFTGHIASIDSLAISPDRNLLASGSHDFTIKLWEINTGKQLQTINTQNIVYAIAFSPDGSMIASSGFENKIKLWDLTSGKNICRLKGHVGWFISVNSLIFSPDGRIIASAGSDKTVKLWDVNTDSEIRILTGHNTWVSSVAFSPNGQIIASGSGDSTAILWDLNTGEILNILNHTGILAAVFSVAFSPDGQIIATASEDNTIKLWKVITGQEICTLKGHSSGVKDVIFSPNGQIIASSSINGDIKLWDMNTKQEICTLTGHSGKVNSLVFSPDGRTLFSGGEDRNIKVWRYE
ncbi:MAG: protein kinase [Cyanobacteria bacterium P01_D01_bin.50]